MALILKGLTSVLLLVGRISLVIIPLFILLQYASESRLLDGLSRWLHPLARFLRISPRSTVPLFVGLVFGLFYGSGVIIHEAKSGEITKKDMQVVVLFLLLCHSRFEDTLVFVAVGVNGLLILGIRFAMAILATWMVSRFSSGVGLEEEEPRRRLERGAGEL